MSRESRVASVVGASLWLVRGILGGIITAASLRFLFGNITE